MDRRDKDTALVIQTLEEIGHEHKYKEGDSYFWIASSNEGTRYNIAVFLDRLDEKILYFDCELPVSPKLPREILLRFLNLMNNEVEFGKFFYDDKKNNCIFKFGSTFARLTPEIIRDIYYITIQTPLKYKQRIISVLGKELLSDNEMTNIIRDESLNGVDEKNSVNTPDVKEPEELDYLEMYAPPDDYTSGPYKLVLQSVSNIDQSEIRMRFLAVFKYLLKESHRIFSLCPYPLKEYISLSRAEKYIALLSDLDLKIDIENDDDIDGPYGLKLIHSGKIMHTIELRKRFFMYLDFTEAETQNYLKSMPCTIKENLSLKRAKRYIELFENMNSDFRPEFEIIKKE